MDRSDDPYDFDDDFEEAVRQYRRTSTPPASGSRQPQDLQPANAETTRAVQSNPDETGYTLTAGYHDCETFGVVKKGKFFSASDFNFKLVAEVICENPSSSGYLVKLTPTGSNVTRLCYFTASSTNRKADFMRCLNSSYRLACLTCSFTDMQLAEYIQFKKRGSPSLNKLFAVSHVGLQNDGSWVLSNVAHISSSARLLKVLTQVDEDEGVDTSIDERMDTITENEVSKYVWIGDVFDGPGVARSYQQCSIELPLSADPLCDLVANLEGSMEHNFLPCVLTMASGIIILHYSLMRKKMKFCPVPLAFGPSGTGKTTSLLCALSLFGSTSNRFYSKVTKEKIIDLCCTSGVPLGVDDPQSKGDISNLIITLYNGAGVGTVSRGDKDLMTSCIIASNFTTVDQQKYASRCMMIEFAEPPLSSKMAEYIKLAELYEKASACVGFCISLGEQFFRDGIVEVDTNITPTLKDLAGPNVSPRVLPAYAILYWFTVQLLRKARMDHKVEDLKKHFSSAVLDSACRLQSCTQLEDMQSSTCAKDILWPIDSVGEAILHCIENLPRPQVLTFFRTNVKYNYRDAYAIVLSKVPGLGSVHITHLKDFVRAKVKPSRGSVSNPRPFLPKHLADEGKIPTDFYKFPLAKCTVVVASLFSEEMQLKLEQVTGFPKRVEKQTENGKGGSKLQTEDGKGGSKLPPEHDRVEKHTDDGKGGSKLPPEHDRVEKHTDDGKGGSKLPEHDRVEKHTDDGKGGSKLQPEHERVEKQTGDGKGGSKLQHEHDRVEKQTGDGKGGSKLHHEHERVEKHTDDGKGGSKVQHEHERVEKQTDDGKGGSKLQHEHERVEKQTDDGKGGSKLQHEQERVEKQTDDGKGGSKLQHEHDRVEKQTGDGKGGSKLQHEHDRVEKQTEDGKGASKLQHEHDRVEKQTEDGKGASKLQHEHERVEKQTEDGKGGSKLQHEHDRVEKQTGDGKGGSKLQHEHERVEKQTEDGKGGSKLQHEHERVEKQTEDGKGGSKLQHEHERVEKQTGDGKGGSKLQHEHERVEKQTEDGKGGSKLQHEHERVEKQTGDGKGGSKLPPKHERVEKQAGNKRKYSTRSTGPAPPLSKKLCKGDSLY